MKNLAKFVTLAILISDGGVAQVNFYSQNTKKDEVQEKDEKIRKSQNLDNKLGTTCPDGSPL